MEREIPITYDEAVAIVKEIGESLGGKQQRACEVILRYAARAKRPSSHRLEAASEAAIGAQHFVNAQRELEKGTEHVMKVVKRVRQAELEELVLLDESDERVEREK